MLSKHIPRLLQGDFRTLARLITAVENSPREAEQLLAALPGGPTRIIGITGPPGAGKSTVVDALITRLTAAGKKIAVLAVDPSSPFHRGALLGDRIRMNVHFSNPQVFIRSLASRGALGGLHPQITQVTTLVTAAGFDYLFIETVGVGQSEVEIAGVAQTVVVVMVPESGDDIQTLKAGLMEIADIFVVNKADHSQAGALVASLGQLARQKSKVPPFWTPPVLETVATTATGIEALLEAIEGHSTGGAGTKARQLMIRGAYRLIAERRMHSLDIRKLEKKVDRYLKEGKTNLYGLVQEFEAEEPPPPGG